MEPTATQRSLRSIEDLMEFNARRAQAQRQAINHGIEQFVAVEEAKSKLAIKAATAPSSPGETFRAQA